MKLFILIALLSPVASSFSRTADFTYKATKSCGGYNSTLSIKNCLDDGICASQVQQSTYGTFVIKFGEDIKEPLFFQYSSAHYRHGKRISYMVDIYGSRYLCNLIDCPIKKDVEYRIPFEIPIDYPKGTIYRQHYKPKDLVRMIATIDNLAGDVEVCAKRDILKSS